MNRNHELGLINIRRANASNAPVAASEEEDMLSPRVLTSLDILGHRGEILWRKLSPAAGSIPIAFTTGSLPVIAAHITAAIGQQQLSWIADRHCHRRPSCRHPLPMRARIKHGVRRGKRHPFNRFELRCPHHDGPS